MATNPYASNPYAEAESTATSNPYSENYKPRGAIAEMANQGYAGVVSDLPKMVGQSLQYASDQGRPIYNFGKRIADAAEKRGQAPDLQPDTENHNVVTNALAAGARMIPQSVAPAALVGAGLMAAPVAVPAAVGLGVSALAGSVPFAMSQGQSTLDKAKAAGVSDEVAIPAARKTAAIEGLGETVGTYFGGKLLGIGGKAIGSAMGRSGGTVAGRAMEDATSRSVVKPFVKQLPETAAIEVGTEMGQGASQAYIEKQAGIDTQTPWDAAKEVIGPTLGMTAILGVFGIGGHSLRARANAKRADTLSSADANPEQRGIAAMQIQAQIAQVDKQAAANFGEHASQAIQTGQPIQIGEHLFAPLQPAPTEENASAGFDPSTAVPDTTTNTPVGGPDGAEVAPSGQVAVSPPTAPTPSQSMGLDPAAGPISAAAAIAVDGGVTDLVQRQAAEQAAADAAKKPGAKSQKAPGNTSGQDPQSSAASDQSAAGIRPSTPGTSQPVAGTSAPAPEPTPLDQSGLPLVTPAPASSEQPSTSQFGQPQQSQQQPSPSTGDLPQNSGSRPPVASATAPAQEQRPQLSAQSSQAVAESPKSAGRAPDGLPAAPATQTPSRQSAPDAASASERERVPNQQPAEGRSSSSPSPIVPPRAPIGKSITDTDPSVLVGRPENGLQKAIRERREAKDGLITDFSATTSKPPEKPSVTQASQPVQGQTQQPQSTTKDGAASVDAGVPAGKPAAVPAVEGVAQGAAAGTAVIDEAANAAATSPRNDLPDPTDAQKKAGNYAKGHVKLAGMDVSIENPAGSVRSGKDRDGKAWSNTLKSHYGYFRGTMGNDKDHVDAFIKPDTPTDYAGPVFVVDQVHPDTGRFDEHKVLIGFQNALQARHAYQANYAKGWKGLKNITAMPMDEFKAWVYDGAKNQPLAPVTGSAPANRATGVQTSTDQKDDQASRPQSVGGAVPSESSPSGVSANDPSPSRASETPPSLSRTLDKASPDPTPIAPAGKVVSTFTGKYKKGMTVFAAKAKASELNKSGDGITYTAEEHGDASLENAYAVVGREAAKPVAAAPAPKPATRPERPANNLRRAAYDRNPIMTFLATHGLFHDKDKPRSQKKEFSPDKAVMVMGYGPVFRKTGLMPDLLTERAIEEGYLPKDGTESQMQDLIRRAIGGEKILPLYAQGVAESEMERRAAARAALEEERAQEDNTGFDEDDAQQAADDVGALSDAELLAIDDDIPWDAPGNASEADAMRAMGFSEQEITDATAEKQGVSPQSGEGNAVADEGSTGQAPRDSGQGNAQPRPGAEQEGLTAPSRAEVLSQQAQREAEEQRKKDGGDKPAPSKPLTGDVPDMFNTQGSVFDAPPDPNVGPAKALELPRLSNPDALRAKADLQNALADLGDIFNRPFKANITPEQEQKLIPVLVRVFDAAFRMGYHKFKDVAKFALDQIRAALGNEAADALTIDHLQGAYISMSGGKTGVDTKRAVIDVENKADIESHTAKAQNQPEDSKDVPSTDSSMERGGAQPAAESAVGAPVPPGPSGVDQGTGQDRGSAQGQRGGRASDSSVPVDGAPVGGERGDKLLRGGNGAGRAASGDARTDFGERSGDSGITGIPFELIPTSQVDAVAGKGIDEIRNRQAQRAADSIDVKPGNLQNIRDTLPYLHEGQQDDVHKAEQVFAKPTGYGMLFTNGTGTGKTFSGLGIVKRAERQGKKNSLIVVPDDKIADDWIESGKALGLNITKLASTKDAGKGVVITTYANLGENDALAKRKWDLVVPDEAHSLMQSADGGVTGYLRNLRAITHHPDGAFDRFTMLNRSDIERLSFIGKEISANSRIMGNSDTMDAVRASLLKENEKLESEAQPLRAKLQAAREAVMLEVRDAQGAGRTRLAFLSATPFAYEKTVDWANGYLFDYKDGYPYTETSLAYNQPNAREHFFMTRFGYSMRFNKLTEPNGAKVDRGLLQRQFNGELKKKGVLSGRMLDVKPDYDRRFVLVDSAIGNKIDEAVEWLNEKARTGPAESEERRGYSSLRDRINESFDYLSRRYLLEAIKAQEVIPIIKKHMAMGRKVVVFHDYKKGGSVNPFDVSTGSAGASVDPDMLAKVRSFNAANTEFRAAFPELIAGLNGLRAPIEVFRGAFPDVLLVNGDEKKADLLKRYKQFQNDDTGPLVMLVQSAKNKGWSGHDTTGKNQRVLINLGQPTAPTLAIQQEGRIYRTGQASNAIMRYLNTGTNWERWAFATTIATRASTAENLGMGELSRALKDSFIASFEESDTYPPGHEGEGTGGKERDKAANNSITEYDRAKTFYWATQKKNSKTKAQEGADYFATPEPVGYKMVEWLDARPGEDLLEPSAGYGAISRWMPDTAKRTVVEPSTALRSRLAMVMSPEQDRIIAGTFEDLAVVNKYDGIAMNPPFGTAGRTAIDHLAKAATHLRDGGRVVALIPTGPSADKKFEKWFYEASEKPIKQLGSAMIDGQEVPIYKGDTVESRATWAPTGIVTGWREGAPMVKAVDKEFGGATSMVSAASILRVRSTGARTETYSPTADLHLIASIRLPQVTFERAGTAVATRIVVIEKQTDKASAPNTGGTQDRDLTDIDDINELFDRLENIALPGRQKADAPAAEAAPAQQERAPEPVKQAAPAAPVGADVILDGNPYKVEIYTTNAGKELRGVWVPRREIALKYGASTFKKQGFGFFVRERDFPKDGNTQFSRNTTGRGVPMADANAIVDAVRAALPTAPPIHILESIDKAPDDLKADIIKHGAQDDVDAAFHNGEIYVFPNNINSIERMAFVLAHHEIRHYGFRAMLGPKAGPIFLAIHATNPSIRAAAAEQVAKGYAKSRVLAVEEALADMPVEELVKLNGFDRIIAALREFLRSVASSLRRKGMAGLADAIDPKVWTDKDVAALIARAEGVSRGGSAKYRTPGTVFAEGAKPDQTQTAAFKKWFGKSAVVDKDGKPLVVYHGTGTNVGNRGEFMSGDFNVFDSRMSGKSSKTGAPEASFFFTDKPDVASSYTVSWRGDFSENLKDGANVMPVYVAMNNPLKVNAKGENWREILYKGEYRDLNEIVQLAKESGKYDGVVVSKVVDNGVGATTSKTSTTYVAFNPEQIKSATGNNGDFDGTNSDIRFARSTITGQTARASWDAPEESQFDSMVYTLQDKQIDTRRVVESIRKASASLGDQADVYLQEELFHGRAAKRTQDFVDRELKPAIVQMQMRGVKVEQLDEYLHARHAEEANKLIAERNPDLQDAGSGMSTADAQAYLAKLDPKQKAHLEAVAAKIDAIIKNTRDLYAAYGLESADTVNGWATMFKHYVPLMREDHDGGMGIGQGFSIKGRETKGRTGSANAKVVDILANIALQRERAIVRGEKNRVSNALVGLAQANPNPDFWRVGPPSPVQVYNPKTNQVEDRADPLFKSRDNVIVAKVLGADGKVTEQAVMFNESNERALRMSKSLKNMDATQLEGLLGTSAKITRYFSAINTVYNPLFGVVNLVRDFQGAIVNLSSTPLASHQKEIAGHTLSALKGIYIDARAVREGKTPTSTWAALWEEFQNEGGQTGYRDLFRTSADRADSIKHELDPTKWMESGLGKFFTAGGRLKVPLAVAQKGATGMFGWLSDYNLAMENAVRLAAYKTALEQGMSKQRAASLGKNLTVNFNRRGQAGLQMGALYAFANASMQGSARLAQTLFTMDGADPSTIRLSRTGKKIVYGGVLLGTMQALLLAAAGFDDEEPPDFVRERNLIIPIGGKNYVTIPMPLGLHILPNLGRIPTEFALGGFKKPAEHVTKMLGLFIDAFNPIGGGASLVQTLAPTAIDPIVALAENKDWTGKPIARTGFNPATPGHKLARDTASAPAKFLSESINFLSGGTDHVRGVFSPTPDQIDYLWGQVTGGVGREANKIDQTVSAAFSGEALPPYKIPLIGRFYGNSDSQSSQSSSFYANLNRINEHEAEVKGLRKEGKGLEAGQYIAANPEAVLIAAANAAERQIRKMRTEKRDMVARDAPASQIREKEKQISERMQSFNEVVKRLREKQAA